MAVEHSIVETPQPPLTDICVVHTLAATNDATMNNFIHLSVYVGGCQ